MGLRVCVLAIISSSGASAQFIDDMVSLFIWFSQLLGSGCRRSANRSLGFTIVKNSERRVRKGAMKMDDLLGGHAY